MAIVATTETANVAAAVTAEMVAPTAAEVAPTAAEAAANAAVK